MTVPDYTSTHMDFNEWLEECPLQWFRESLESDQVTYVFILPMEEDDNA